MANVTPFFLSFPLLLHVAGKPHHNHNSQFKNELKKLRQRKNGVIVKREKATRSMHPIPSTGSHKPNDEACQDPSFPKLPQHLRPHRVQSHRLLRSYGPNALDGLASFRFEAIPDGLSPTYADATQDIPSLCRSIDLHCLVPFQDLLCRLNGSGHGGGGVPPVSCIVSDVSMCFTLDAAEELGIPEVMLWTSSSCGCLGMAQYDQLIQLGLVPFKGSSVHVQIACAIGLLLPPKDVKPSFPRPLINPR